MKMGLADTNFYGLLVYDGDRLEIVKRIKTGGKVVIYGFKVIRNELRDVPKSSKIGKRNLRIDLLSLYDSVVIKHILNLTPEIQKTAGDYFKAYREFGGIKPEDEINKDFIIIAAASLNQLDVLVSDDRKSMLSDSAIRAYNLVNSITDTRTPKFISYGEFKKQLRGGSNEFL